MFSEKARTMTVCHIPRRQSSPQMLGDDDSSANVVALPSAVEPELEQNHPVGDWARIALEQTVWLREPKAAMAWIRIVAYIQHWGSIPAGSLRDVAMVSPNYLSERVWPYIQHQLEAVPDRPSYYRLSGDAP